MKLTEKSLAAATILVMALFLQTPDGLPIWGPVPAAAQTTVSDTIQSDTTWTREGSPYIVTGDVRVLGKDGDDGVTTLTIEAGVTIKFDRYQSLVIGTSDGKPGALAAMGEPDLPILFTSNEASPAPGDWQCIRFNDTTDDNVSQMSHCEVRFGGLSGGAIYLYQASPKLRGLSVTQSGNYGIYVSSGHPSITGCQFSDNGNYDLHVAGSAGGSVSSSIFNSGFSLMCDGMVRISGNRIHQNNARPIRCRADMVGTIVNENRIDRIDENSRLEIAGGDVRHDAVWTKTIPYFISDSVNVYGTDGDDKITMLTIRPGVLLTFGEQTALSIGADTKLPASLSAQGTPDNPIVFTSAQADPQVGDWEGIKFYDATDDPSAVLSHCRVAYAGYGNHGMIYLNDAKPTIAHSTFEHSSHAAIFASGKGSGGAQIRCNTFSDNTFGIYCTYHATPTIHLNNFSGNRSDGVYNSSEEMLTADHNWWGDPLGPGTGGDAAHGNVRVKPWSQRENRCDDKRANCRSCPASDGSAPPPESQDAQTNEHL